jgi:hypothetical protein
MNKSRIIKLVVFVVIVYAGLLYNSYTLNYWWADFTKRTKEGDITFVAMTRNVDVWLDICQEYQLFAKRKWYYQYEKIEKFSFCADRVIPSTEFLPIAKVFEEKGMKYVAVFIKKWSIVDRTILSDQLSKVIIYDSHKRMSNGRYNQVKIDGFNCQVDSVLSVSKNKMIGVKAVLHSLDQDTSCIRNIIDCFPDYTCSTVKVWNSHNLSSK